METVNLDYIDENSLMEPIYTYIYLYKSNEIVNENSLMEPYIPIYK